MMKKALALLILVLLVNSRGVLLAKELDAQKSPGYGPIIEQFFAALSDGKTEGAVNELWSTNPWMSQKKDDIETFKSKLSSLSSLMGKTIGYKTIKQKMLTDRVCYNQTVVYYERQPVVFTLVIYLATDRWQLQNLSYNYDIEKVVAQLKEAEQPGAAH